MIINEFIDMITSIICVFIFILILAFIVSMPWISFKLNTSYGDVYVNNKIVYTGRLYFISVDSVGENGNTKRLRIYKGVPRFKVVEQYISNDIKVTSRELD